MKKLHIALMALALLFLVVMPTFAKNYGIHMFTTWLVFIIATMGLNLTVGYAGQKSLGHAAFFGIGAYTVGILITEGVPNGWIGFTLAMAIAAAFAAVIGAVSLRTRGVYFIMITLAFAQMVFYLVNSVKAYGGD